MSDSVGKLLDELASRRPDAAWANFLEHFSTLLMQVIRQFEDDAERAGECYLFVCERLSDNQFRRLLSFRRNGPAQFPTWLRTVTANVCIDWCRKRHGRVRPPARIADLPLLEQEVFRLIYVRGSTRNECLRALERKFPGLTAQKISEINTRLFSKLSPRQRWKASSRAHGAISLDEATSDDPDELRLQLADPAMGPELLASQDQTRASLERALSHLPPKQRLLLRLRYQQDLTLNEVARLMGLADPYKANREIQAALTDLATFLPAEEP
jgi:RNA polymerase sigma factor (sigma-70 family)